MVHRSPYPFVTIPDISLTPLVLRRAEHLADKPALVDSESGRALTYGELVASVRRTAAGLAQHGLRKGDVFAMFVPNCLEYAIAFHAVASLGGIVMPINPLSTIDELTHRLYDASAVYLLAAPETLENAREAARRAPVRELFVIGAAPGELSIAALVAPQRYAAPEVSIDAERDLAALLYSSGTSGLPKGVMLSHRNLVASLCQLSATDSFADGDIVFGILPFFHVYGLSILNLALGQGVTLAILPRFELATCLQAMQDYGVTHAYLAPPVVVSLSKHPIVDNFDLSKLRLIHSGGAPLGEAVARRCAARLGCQIKQGYALTEGYPAIRMGIENLANRRFDTVGRCASNTECKVVDPESGAELGSGQPGEIWLRGPQVMQGYLNQPEATAQAITQDAWLRTGDIGYADEGGYFTIVDRMKELIKYKGYQVAPAELEAILLSHPAVSDAAVIPSPDEETGEVPKAFVVRSAEVTADEVMSFVNAQVAPYKKIRRLEFIDAIPKSPSGKILRRLLVERERAPLTDPVLA